MSSSFVLLLAISLLSVFSLCSAGLYGPKTQVITTITKDNFAKEVIQSNEMYDKMLTNTHT